MENVITSVNNPIIVSAKKLNTKKYRTLNNAVLIEGVKFILDAFNSGMPIKQIFVDKNKYSEHKDFIERAKCPFYLISEHIVSYLADSESPQGLFAEFDITKKINSLKPPDGNFLVLDCLQDPGNVGTIVRTAAASGFDTIYLINSADYLSAKVIRSSAGMIFKINLFNVSYDELLKITSENKLNLICADMKGENIYKFKPNLSSFGIVIGNEGNGVSEVLRGACKFTVSLPMKNGVESLNAGVTASILMYTLLEVK